MASLLLIVAIFVSPFSISVFLASLNHGVYASVDHGLFIHRLLCQQGRRPPCRIIAVGRLQIRGRSEIPGTGCHIADCQLL